MPIFRHGAIMGINSFRCQQIFLMLKMSEKVESINWLIPLEITPRPYNLTRSDIDFLNPQRACASARVARAYIW
jgi:hypothetical protein